MKDIILNKMPVLTWRWLKMNETALSVPSETSTANIKVLNENANNELSNENIEKMTLLPTGMGESMSELMSEGSEYYYKYTCRTSFKKSYKYMQR